VLSLCIAVLLVAGLPIAIGVTIVLLRRAYRAVRARQVARRRLREMAGAEARARALMSELCPHGWRAQITLFERGDELPEDAPADRRRARVALDWSELQDDRDHVAVMRRVWAPTIADALEAMVADRRTDETLEQIERAAGVDGGWPDLR
jgi:hypothetical protein